MWAFCWHLQELGGETGETALLLALTLEEKLHSDLTSLLNDTLLVSARLDIALGRLIIEKLHHDHQHSVLEASLRRAVETYLGSLRHSQTQEAALVLLVARLTLVP